MSGPVVSSAGSPCPGGLNDLIITAHALQTERIVLTFDAKARFGDRLVIQIMAIFAGPLGMLLTGLSAPQSWTIQAPYVLDRGR